MPEIGEIKSPSELGVANSHRRMWVICPVCGQGRWVILTATKRKGFTGRCHQCNISVRGGYRLKKGGRCQTHGKTGGYIKILLQPDDFFYPMISRDGYVFEHRLVVAKRLGRCLQPWEIVHHKDHIRDHNEDDNLQLTSDIGHKQLSILETFICKLQKKNEALRLENKELRRRLSNV